MASALPFRCPLWTVMRPAAKFAGRRWAQYPHPRRRIATYTHSHQAAQLSILPTAVDTSSEEYKTNSQQFDDLMSRLEDLHKKIAQGGPQKARDKHVARGKMLPREYVQLEHREIARVKAENTSI